MSVYRPTFLTPQGVAIDGTLANEFKAQVNGSMIDAYQLRIYSLINVLIYDSGKIDISLNPLYDKEILTHIVPSASIINDNIYKWSLETWEGTSSASSREIQFYAYTMPVISFSNPSEITSNKYTFELTYSQAQNIPVEKWKMDLYGEDDKLIESTDWIFNQRLQYTFDSFINEKSYYIIGTVITNYSFEVEETTNFSIAYTPPSTIISPNVSLLPDIGTAFVEWSGAVVIEDIQTGAVVEEEDFLVPGNSAMNIDVDSNVLYDVDIPESFTCRFIVQMSLGFTGILCELDGDDGNFIIGFNGSSFYYEQGLAKVFLPPIPDATAPYFVIVRPTEVDFIPI